MTIETSHDRRREMPAEIVLRKFAELCPHRPDGEDVTEMVFVPEDAAVLSGEVGQIRDQQNRPRVVVRARLDTNKRGDREAAEALDMLSTVVSVNVARLLLREPHRAIEMRVGDPVNAPVRDALRERQWLEHPFDRVYRKFNELRRDLRALNVDILPEKKKIDHELLLKAGKRPHDWAERVGDIATALEVDAEQIVHDLRKGKFNDEALEMCKWILMDKDFEAHFAQALLREAKEPGGPPVAMREILRAAERTMTKQVFNDHVAIPAAENILSSRRGGGDLSL